MASNSSSNSLGHTTADDNDNNTSQQPPCKKMRRVSIEGSGITTTTTTNNLLLLSGNGNESTKFTARNHHQNNAQFLKRQVTIDQDLLLLSSEQIPPPKKQKTESYNDKVQSAVSACQNDYNSSAADMGQHFKDVELDEPTEVHTTTKKQDGTGIMSPKVNTTTITLASSSSPEELQCVIPDADQAITTPEHPEHFLDSVPKGISVQLRARSSPTQCSLLGRGSMIVCQLVIQVAVFILYVMSRQQSSQLSFPNQDCIYVPGGGFSGMWYLLGKLQSIPNPKEQNFVCYSAGCLGVVATLNNMTMKDTFEIAALAREEWLQGKRHRFELVEFFVNGLLGFNNENKEHEEDKNTAATNTSMDTTVLNRIHIVTSTTDPQSALPMATLQVPSDLNHLKRLLIQTSWIPLGTGSHYSHFGHLDGVFSAWQHPICNDRIGVPSLWEHYDLHANALNPNINMEMATKFWTLGYFG